MFIVFLIVTFFERFFHCHIGVVFVICIWCGCVICYCTGIILSSFSVVGSEKRYGRAVYSSGIQSSDNFFLSDQFHRSGSR